MKTELKDVIYLYLGCYAKYVGDSDTPHPYLNEIDVYQLVSFEGYYGNGNHIYWLNGISCKIGVSSYNVKPILRPLSDINISQIMRDYFFNTDRDGVEIELQLISNGVYNIEKCSFRVVYALMKEHYDVFGLVESGQAIDKTTLNK